MSTPETQTRFVARANARYDNWAHQQWRDDLLAARKPTAPREQAEAPLHLGDLLIVVWIACALAAVVSLGPWL